MVPLLVRKLVSPPYAAVTVSLGTGRAEPEYVQLAVSGVPPLRMALQRNVPPEVKVTVPVGVPAPGATELTVALKVTC